MPYETCHQMSNNGWITTHTEMLIPEYRKEINGYELLILQTLANRRKYGFLGSTRWVAVLLGPDGNVIWKDATIHHNYVAATRLEEEQARVEATAVKYNYRELP